MYKMFTVEQSILNMKEIKTVMKSFIIKCNIVKQLLATFLIPASLKFLPIPGVTAPTTGTVTRQMLLITTTTVWLCCFSIKRRKSY